MKETLKKIPLFRPHIGGEEIKFINQAINDNWIAPVGPQLDAFEKSLENYLGKNNHVAALNSGTAALHLSLILLGIEKGDEVICQDLTFAASVYPIVYQGATPIFVDSELDSWNICPIHLENAIKDRISKGKKPKAIIAVHLYGMPFNVDDILKISKKYEIPLIEDSAESFGSFYDDKKCGTFGDLSILSFNGSKVITTSGGGGLITRSSEMKENAIFLATQAKDKAPHYQHSQIGYNYRLSNICASIGLGQMLVLDKHLSLRKDIHQFYQSLFNELEGIEVFNEPSGKYKSNHWLNCILIDKKLTRLTPEMIRLKLEKELIEVRNVWKPMHLQPVFKDAPYYGEKISEKLFNEGLCLPSASNLTNEELDRIILAFDFLK